jgi:hypothetical protein
MHDWAVGNLRENVLSAQVEAALQGHELGEFRPVDGIPILGYEAFCSKCALSVWVNDKAVHSALPEKCPTVEVYND